MPLRYSHSKQTLCTTFTNCKLYRNLLIVPELNNIYNFPTRAEATAFHDEDEIDLHPRTSENIISLDDVRKKIAQNGVEMSQQETTAHYEAVPEYGFNIALRESADVVSYRKYRQDSEISLDDSGEVSRIGNVFNGALKLLTGTETRISPFRGAKKRPFRALSERELIQKESEVGSQLFGPIPADHRREFFCLDEITWIWYEETIDVETGKPKSTTTRYELHDNGILKAQEGAQYSYLEGDELQNLFIAIHLYHDTVVRDVYNYDSLTAQKAA
jgi:hypothetical protein